VCAPFGVCLKQEAYQAGTDCLYLPQLRDDVPCIEKTSKREWKQGTAQSITDGTDMYSVVVRVVEHSRS
jgi:hypothetical protein